MSLTSELFLLAQSLPPILGTLSVIERPRILNTIFMSLIITLANFTHRVIKLWHFLLDPNSKILTLKTRILMVLFLWTEPT